MAASRRTAPVVDFRETQPELYRATLTVQELRIGRGTFLARDGVSAPGDEAYQAAIGSMFALAYTAKFALKGAGIVDFSVPPLECLWFSDPKKTPRKKWRWRLLLRIPDEVSARDLQTVRKTLMERKKLDTSAVQRMTWAEGQALQLLNVGPYDTVGAAYERLKDAAKEHGARWSGPGHEIYLSDPRRVAPSKIKTIVRIAVTKRKGR